MASNGLGFSLSGDDEVPDSEVSTLELFFDLVFVFGFIQVGQFLLANRGHLCDGRPLLRSKSDNSC